MAYLLKYEKDAPRCRMDYVVYTEDKTKNRHYFLGRDENGEKTLIGAPMDVFFWDELKLRTSDGSFSDNLAIYLYLY